MKRKYVVLIHILVWILFILSDAFQQFTSIPAGNYKTATQALTLFSKYIIIYMGFSCMGASAFYGSYLTVAPQLFIRKNYIRSAIYTLLILAGTVCLRYLIEYGFFLPVLGFDNYRGSRWPVGRYIQNAVLFYLPRHFCYGLILFFVEQWYNSRRLQQDLQKEKLTAELAFLRSQINPHFIFNTINDIYSLTYRKSDQAPLALLKLSEILRYMLREGQHDLVTLADEVRYLENVVELQRISAKGDAHIRFSAVGVIDGQKVAALLFIAFVENAFKHGILNDQENPVYIQLEAHGPNISFFASNRINKHQKDSTGGIGLTNIRRRLELMYPNKYRLDTHEEDGNYIVNLSLNL